MSKWVCLGIIVWIGIKILINQPFLDNQLKYDDLIKTNAKCLSVKQMDESLDHFVGFRGGTRRISFLLMRFSYLVKDKEYVVDGKIPYFENNCQATIEKFQSPIVWYRASDPGQVWLDEPPKKNIFVNVIQYLMKELFLPTLMGLFMVLAVALFVDNRIE